MPRSGVWSWPVLLPCSSCKSAECPQWPSQNTGCKHGPWTMVRTSRVDSWNLRCRIFFITNSEWWKDVTQRYDVQWWYLVCKIYSPWSLSVREKVGRFWCVSGWELPRAQKTSPRASAHVGASCSSHMWFYTNRCPFQPKTLEELPPRPTCLASFITEHFELVLFHVELTSVIASLTSMAEARAWQLNESMQQL